MNCSGQEEAPFELLVAVILMTFVILIGLYAMTEASNRKCLQEKNKDLDNLAAKIQEVANNETIAAAPLSFIASQCGKNEEIKIISSIEAIQCRVCPGSLKSCLLLNYRSDAGYIENKCLNISQATYFDSGDKGCPAKIGDYDLVDLNPENEIERGLYKLEFNQKSTENFPVICAYYKKG
ncbi:MAG: hypothetical protein AB1467_05900 [Candidatus Diapherotrites archaeon]